VPVAETLIELDDVDPEAAPEWAVPYEVYRGRAPQLWDLPGSIGARPALQDFITKVLEAEAPIHREVLQKRVRDAFGIGRVGANIRENIDFVTAKISLGGSKVSVGSDGFIRLPWGTVEVRTPVDEDGMRTAGQVAPEEFDRAVLGIVQDAVLIDEAGILAQVRNIFGWRRVGQDIQAAVSASVARSLRRNDLVKTERGQLRADAA